MTISVWGGEHALLKWAEIVPAGKFSFERNNKKVDKSDAFIRQMRQRVNIFFTSYLLLNALEQHFH